MAKPSIVRKNLAFSLGFGISMGLIFPLYASFFVRYKSSLHAVIFLAGCVVAGIAVGLVAFYITRATILKAVKDVSVRLSAVNIREPSSLAFFGLESADELGALANGFAKTLNEFRSLIAMLKKAVQEATLVGTRLNEGIGRTLEAAKDLGARGSAISASIQIQDTATSRMAESFEELTKKIVVALSGVIELYTYLNQFGLTLITQTETVGHITINMDKLNNRIGGGDLSGDTENHSLLSAARYLEEAAKDAIEAGRQVFNGVREKTRSLDDIAERINILAVNAAIESARLGGKASGFRVIASSIKDLASEAARSMAALSTLVAEGEKALDTASGRADEAFISHDSLIKDIGGEIASLSDKGRSMREAGEELSQNQRANESLLGEIREIMGELKAIVETNKKTLGSAVSEQAAITITLEKLEIDLNRVAMAEETARSDLDAFMDRLKPIQEITGRW